MRTYTTDSAQAAGRLLALTIVSDGNLVPSELAAMHHSRILAHVALDEPQFHLVMQELCEDLLATTYDGAIQLEPDVIDQMLSEIADPGLRRKLLQAMWQIADADDWLADAEAVLLNRACVVWGAETGFARRAGQAAGRA